MEGNIQSLISKIAHKPLQTLTLNTEKRSSMVFLEERIKGTI